MDRYEMEDDVRAKLGSTEVADDALTAYINDAEAVMLSWVWPFDDTKTWDDLPDRVHPATCDVAVYLISKEGAEGETEHSENGTSHTWASAGIPLAMLAHIPRHAGVPK